MNDAYVKILNVNIKCEFEHCMCPGLLVLVNIGDVIFNVTVWSI